MRDEDLTPAEAEARDALLREIRAAFPARRPWPFGPLVNSDLTEEPRRVAAAFSDAEDWTLLEPAWLGRVPDGLGTALCFLSDATACLYLPAFMAAALTEGLDGSHPNVHFVHGADARSRDERIGGVAEGSTWGDLARVRWAGLTAGQAGVVMRYLEWWIALNGAERGRPLVEALDSYWRARAS